MEKKIKILKMTPTENNGEFVEIANTLSAMQEIVGGHIEVVSLDEKGELDLFLNDMGKLNGLPISKVWLHKGKVIEIVAGQAFVARHDGEGNSISVLDSDAELINKTLRPLLSVIGSVILYLTEEGTIGEYQFK